MGRRRTGDEPMVMLSRRVPARVVPALTAEADKRNMTVGELLDLLCQRAGLYTTKLEAEGGVKISASDAGIEIVACEHSYPTTKGMVRCRMCPATKYNP